MEFSKLQNEAEIRPAICIPSIKCPSKFQKYLPGMKLQEHPFARSIDRNYYTLNENWL